MESNLEIKIGGGLQKSKKDSRDISFGKIFQLPKLEELPDEYDVGTPIEIKDQGEDDTCAARSSDAVSEDQELTPLCDYFTFALAKLIEGDPFGWGLQLRSVAKSHVRYGALEKDDCPICNTEDGHVLERDRNWENWPRKEELLALAEKHKKASFLAVAGPYDTFDNFRAILWATRDENRSSFTGATWRGIWTQVPNGFIPKFDLDQPLFGHSFKIKGWRKVEGEIYLTAQLSNGINVGDKGIYYFPRNRVNKEFTYGAYTFSDMPILEIKQLGWSFWIKLLNIFKRWREEVLK